MKTLIFGVANVCLLACLTSAAQTTNTASATERMDTVVKSYVANNHFMGEVLVVDGDRTLLEKGYGSADLEWNIPNGPDVEYRLCSVSKQFTAVLIQLLQEDGKLNIADSVNKYLPEAPASWTKITLEDLLRHTSGIADSLGDKDANDWIRSPHTPAEGFERIRNKPLAFEPGSQYDYSNANYLVLGMVIEKVSGQKYGDLLLQRILQPLGMQHSGLDNDELVLPKRAEGYNPAKNGVVSARQMMSGTLPWAAGSIYSTTGDLLLWERGLFGGKVLNETSLKAMTTAGKGGEGLGVVIADEQGLKVIEHSGGMPGYSAQLTYVPERKLAVIILSNVYGSGAPDMAAQLLDVALGKPVVLASERKPVPIAQSELGKFVGLYDVSAAFSIAIAVNGDTLTAQGNTQGKPMAAMYQGIVDGHPRFYLPKVDAEIEFVTDATGAVNSMVLHQGGDHPAKKR